MPEQNGKALLIDSEPTLTQALSDALMDAGLFSFEPLVSTSEEHALAVLAGDSSVTFVVLDIGLPGAGGQRLAKTILARFPHVRLLLTSALLCGEVRAEFEGSVLGMLEKPFDLEEFLQLSFKGLSAP